MQKLQTLLFTFAVVLFFPTVFAHAQAPTPKSASPSDFTGYWVSVVTEDWLYRMVTPAKGDAISIPVNAAGQQAANAWRQSGGSGWQIPTFPNIFGG